MGDGDSRKVERRSDDDEHEVRSTVGEGARAGGG